MFRAGNVLGRSLRIWARNVVPFTILYAIVYLPFVALVILRLPRARGDTVDFLFLSFVLLLGFCLLWYIAPLAVIHGVLQELRGERASFLGCLRVYLTRLFPVLGVGLLAGFLAFLTMIPASIVAGIIVGAAGRSLGPPLTLLALLPSVYVMCMYWVAVPVAAAERPGVAEALRRSARLTRGSRLSVFVVALVVIALLVVPVIVFGTVERGPAQRWVLLAILMTLGSYGAVATSVTYHDLRVAKDGVGVDDLIRVFS